MLVAIAPMEFCSRVSKNSPARMSMRTQNWARVNPIESSAEPTPPEGWSVVVRVGAVERVTADIRNSSGEE